MTPLRVGLTGGVGSGKSTALEILRGLGAVTVSCDDIAHRLSEPGRPVHRAAVRVLGRGVLDADGRLDRAQVARRVFRDARLRRRLERATHPPILAEVRRRLRGADASVAVVDVPLLFEAGLGGEFDVTLAVSAPRRAVLRRLASRGWSAAESRRRMRAQWPDRLKAAAADVAVPNAGTRAELRRRLAGLWAALALLSRGAAAAACTRNKPAV